MTRKMPCWELYGRGRRRCVLLPLGRGDWDLRKESALTFCNKLLQSRLRSESLQGGHMSERSSMRQPTTNPYHYILVTNNHRVSLNAHILSKGLVLVDLPGRPSRC